MTVRDFKIQLPVSDDEEKDQVKEPSDPSQEQRVGFKTHRKTYRPDDPDRDVAPQKSARGSARGAKKSVIKQNTDMMNDMKNLKT